MMIRTGLVGVFCALVVVGALGCAVDDDGISGDGKGIEIFPGKDPDEGTLFVDLPQGITPGRFSLSYQGVPVVVQTEQAVPAGSGCLALTYDTRQVIDCSIEIQQGQRTTYGLSFLDLASAGPTVRGIFTGAAVELAALEPLGTSQPPSVRIGGMVPVLPGSYDLSWAGDGLNVNVPALSVVKVDFGSASPIRGRILIEQGIALLPDARPDDACMPQVLAGTFKYPLPRQPILVGKRRDDTRAYAVQASGFSHLLPFDGTYGGDVQTLRLDRLDVHHPTVRGADSPGFFSVRRSVPGGGWGGATGNCAADLPTGTGIWLPPGTYQITVTYKTPSGFYETEEHVAVLE